MGSKQAFKGQRVAPWPQNAQVMVLRKGKGFCKSAHHNRWGQVSCSMCGGNWAAGGLEAIRAMSALRAIAAEHTRRHPDIPKSIMSTRARALRANPG